MAPQMNGATAGLFAAIQIRALPLKPAYKVSIPAAHIFAFMSENGENSILQPVIYYS
jgi:hypothetical protein